MLKSILVIVFIAIGVNYAYADQIFTTVRSDANNTIFDGKWTFLQEWKSTSEDKITFDDNTEMVIKTGHDYENLYVLIDFIGDTSIGKFADSGIVCIDSKMDQSNIPDRNDFCFVAIMGSSRSKTLQGGDMLAQTGHWKIIENHPQLITIGGISDKNDRYSYTPHATYEFKIPLEIVGKTDVYGFYVGSFDAKKGKEFSWPQNISSEAYPFIPSPSKWGQLVSPDKSIPEFPYAFLALLSITFTVFFTSRKIRGY